MVIVQFYQRCGERFRDLVALEDVEGDAAQSGGTGPKVPGSEYALSSMWAQRPEMAACLTEIRDPKTPAQRRAELLAQETRFELAFAGAKARAAAASDGAGEGGIAIHELTTSRKKLMALGCLQHSVEWFAVQIARLKPVSIESASASFDEEGGKKEDELRSSSTRAKARLSVFDPLALHHGTSTNGSPANAGEGESDEGEGYEQLPLPLTPDLIARYPSLSAVYTRPFVLYPLHSSA